MISIIIYYRKFGSLEKLPKSRWLKLGYKLGQFKAYEYIQKLAQEQNSKNAFKI